MLEEFDGATAVPTSVPTKVPAWVQLHLIPPLYKTEAILKMLTESASWPLIILVIMTSTICGI
jgi:hypothetical protein